MPLKPRKSSASSNSGPVPPPPPERIAFLNLVALATEDGKPPEEFRIFAKGTVETAKGIFKFSEASGGKVMAAAKRYGNDYPVDYGHAMHSFIALDPAESGKAAGWFTPEVRADGLYATRVQWTPKASGMLTAREYRYISPVFSYSTDGDIEELRSVGLTNLPATYGLQPLMASQHAPQSNPSEEAPEKPTMELEQLIAMLSLPAGSTLGDAMAALSRMNASFSQLVQLTSQKSPETILATVAAWKAGSETAAELAAKLKGIEVQLSQGEVKVLLDQGRREGKLPPAVAEMMLSWPKEQVEAYLKAAPAVFAKPATEKAIDAPAPGGGRTTSVTHTQDGRVVVELTQEQKDVAELMQIPPAAVARHVASRVAEGRYNPGTGLRFEIAEKK